MKRFLAVLLTAVLMLPCLVVGAAADGEVREITVFFKNELPWDNMVAEAITRITGVKLSFVPVAGDAAEKLNTMLQSDTLPDIIAIDRGAAANDNYIANGAVIPLDDLIEQYAPNIKAQLGGTLDKVRNLNDGKVYGLPSWFQDEVAPSAVFGFNLRMNYVKELGYYDTYVEQGYFTKDQFVSLLKEWKAKYPEINGHKTIPLCFNADNESATMYTFRGMYGIDQYYVDENGSLFSNIRDPHSKDMYLFMNELYRDGLIDIDWPSCKKALFDEKCSGGYVLGAPEAYWNIANTALQYDAEGNKNDDNMMYPFMVVADGVDPAKTTYGPTSVLGWTYTYISADCKDPIATIKFMDWLMSEEGQYVTQWGPEGVTWNYVDGKRVLTDETIDALNADFWNFLTENGIRKYELLFKSGIAQDGQYYDLNSAFPIITGSQNVVAAFANKYLGVSAYDTTSMDNLSPDSGSMEALISTKTGDIRNAAFPMILMAESEEEAAKLFDQMLADCEAAGLSQVEAIANEKYQAKMSIWNEE
ncbi:MAG: extracellular solute-binding protein [Clostridia bacterium]|nr:extracellular solute-binding protein [Clostridia bacterium]